MKVPYAWIILLVVWTMFMRCILFQMQEPFGEEDHCRAYVQQFQIYDEKNDRINTTKLEYKEQCQAYRYIRPDDCVLELGARYGSVSIVTNSLLTDKTRHVVIEPDTHIVPTLTANRDRNGAQFVIVDKFISYRNDQTIVYDGYGTRIIRDTTTSGGNKTLQISYAEFKRQHSLPFNVLIADCEGCLEEMLTMMGDDLNQYRMVILEADQPEICNYEKVYQHLESRGFQAVESKGSFRNVYLEELDISYVMFWSGIYVSLLPSKTIFLNVSVP